MCSWWFTASDIVVSVSRWIDSSGWRLTISYIHQTQPELLPKNLTFWPLSEAFIRRSWYSVLPVLDTMRRCRVKKAVVCVAQLVAALIAVHGLLSFLSDVYGLCDPSAIKRSGSLLITIAWDQLMTWFRWVAWLVRADLLYSVKLDALGHERRAVRLLPFERWTVPHPTAWNF